MKLKQASIQRFSAGYSMPRGLHDYIEKEVHNQTYILENIFFEENKFLPPKLITLSYERKIFSTNKKIEQLRLKHGFERLQLFDYERKNITLNEELKEGVFCYVKFTDDDGNEKMADYDMETREYSNIRDFVEKKDDEMNGNEGELSLENIKVETMPGFLIDSCVSILEPDEFEEYRNFDHPNTGKLETDRFFAEMDLPKIAIITNYLSLIRYYDKLIQDYDDISNGKYISSTKDNYQFKTTLNRGQIDILFKLLISNKLIDASTQEKTFLFAFGIGEEIEEAYIGWKNTKNLAPYLIDSLSNYITNLDKKWKIGENIFGIKHMAKKVDNYFNASNNKKTKKHKIIDDILLEVLQNKGS
jgi:hypothetical protein